MSRSVRLLITTMMLLTAGVLGIFTWRMSHPFSSSVQLDTTTPPPLRTAYIVTAHPLPAGTLARDDDFTVKQMLPGAAPPGAIVDRPEARLNLRGALIRKYLDTGTPVTKADVLRPRDRGFIASVLQPGTRAVSIGVDAVSGVAGLIWPGDHVDVVLTQELKNASIAHRVLSETIMRNVRVIAIDQEMVQGPPASNNPSAGKLVHTVTLQVTPGQVQKIAVASHLGKLSLDIRAAIDRTGGKVEATTYSANVSPALARAATPSGTTVTVVEGDKSREVVFK